MTRILSIGGLWVGLAGLLSGCGAAAPHAQTENAFAFRDIERMVSQPAGDDDAAGVALAYQQKLRTFEAMYGEGVGPAKRAPAYMQCRQTFEAVSAAASSPVAASVAGRATEIQQSLLACRRAADGWRSAAEMATFGSDVSRVTSGSLVVLGYALQHDRAGEQGKAIMAQGLTLLRSDRGA